MRFRFFHFLLAALVVLWSATIPEKAAAYSLRWSSAGPITGECVQITEPQDPYTWNDNYLCSDYGGFTWSHTGRIRGQRCTAFDERADPDGWDDNYLCVPEDAPIRLFWSSRHPTGNLSEIRCVQIYEAADLHTWNDNYLCWMDLSETMTDRCSGDVLVSREYTDAFLGSGFLLSRPPGRGETDWSNFMEYRGHTHLRWWCNSTTGNWADLGTWRISGGVFGGVECSGDWDRGEVEECSPTGESDLDITSSARDGWTPERSRCSSGKTKGITARLGRDRLLQFRCWE